VHVVGGGRCVAALVEQSSHRRGKDDDGCVFTDAVAVARDASRVCLFGCKHKVDEDYNCAVALQADKSNGTDSDGQNGTGGGTDITCIQTSVQAVWRAQYVLRVCRAQSGGTVEASVCVGATQQEPGTDYFRCGDVLDVAIGRLQVHAVHSNQAQATYTRTGFVESTHTHIQEWFTVVYQFVEL